MWKAFKIFKKLLNHKQKHSCNKFYRKIWVQVTSDRKRDGVNDKLWYIARLMNLLHAARIEKEKIHIVAMIAGKALPVALTNEAYKKRFRTQNPNMDLLQKLTKQGMKLYVCNQALLLHSIDIKKEVNKYVGPSLSEMTDLILFEIRGYALLS